MVIKNSTGFVVAAALLAAAALADGDPSTVYVNAANYGQAGMDGTSVVRMTLVSSPSGLRIV